jgi:hypothetical protein
MTFENSEFSLDALAGDAAEPVLVPVPPEGAPKQPQMPPRTAISAWAVLQPFRTAESRLFASPVAPEGAFGQAEQAGAASGHQGGAGWRYIRDAIAA